MVNKKLMMIVVMSSFLQVNFLSAGILQFFSGVFCIGGATYCAAQAYQTRPGQGNILGSAKKTVERSAGFFGAWLSGDARYLETKDFLMNAKDNMQKQKFLPGVIGCRMAIWGLDNKHLLWGSGGVVLAVIGTRQVWNSVK